MLKQQHFSPLPFLLILFLHCPTTPAQSPAPAPSTPLLPPPLAPAPSTPLLPPPLAPAPAPPAPPKVTAILEKAGHFSTLIRLLKRTKMDDRLFKQLNNSSPGLTIFAPTDNAFANLLQLLNLNKFTDVQKIQLLQYHVIPTFLPLTEFETLNNPVNTEAGDNTDTEFPLNVTTVSDNQVNITTGIVNTTVSDTIYSDNRLVVYQVDKVLIPLHFLPALSPNPSPSKPEKEAPPPPPQLSGAMGVVAHHGLNAMSLLVSAIAAFCFVLG